MRSKLVAAAAASVLALAVAGPAAAASSAADPGLTAFNKGGCGACHTLAVAKAKGAVGPNLDKTKPSAAIVTARVTSGKGIMPAFKGRLSAAEIKAIATYVSKNAGKKK